MPVHDGDLRGEWEWVGLCVLILSPCTAAGLWSPRPPHTRPSQGPSHVCSSHAVPNPSLPRYTHTVEPAHLRLGNDVGPQAVVADGA